MSLPTEADKRKGVPIATGVVDYFPDALAAVAELSKIGNDQHNPGKPLHWDRSKSGDEADALMRHFVERGKRDVDGVRHSAKVAWRALALLQKEIEADDAWMSPLDPDGCIPWTRRECPVPPDTPVEVRFHVGATNNRCRAGAWRWGSDDKHPHPYSIVAYRVV